MIKERGIVLLKEDFCEQWLDIMSECGLNVLGLHVLDLPGAVGEYLLWLKKPEVSALIEKFEAKGIRVEHELHAMSYLLPRDLYSRSPAMFRMENGVRVEKNNYCPSDMGASSLVSQRAAELGRALSPSTHRYYLWQDDNAFGERCTCARCADFNVPDQNMLMMKDILAGLRREDGAARLAYLQYDKDHALPDIPVPDGLFLEFAPISRNHAKALTDPSDGENAAFVRELGALGKLFDMESAHILEYFLDVSLYCGWDRGRIAPLSPDAKVWEADIAFYASFGVNFITTFAAFMDEAYLGRYGYDAVKRYAELLHRY